MTGSAESNPPNVDDQAAQWLARRHAGHWTRREQIALDGWLDSDPAHRAAYLRHQQMWRDLDAAKNDLVTLRSTARNYRPVATAKRPRLTFPALGMVAGLLLATVTAYWHWVGFENRYLTAKGESLEIALADGSSLRLNTDSEVRVRYNNRQRHVELIRGEAFFDIDHDEARPFSVVAGNGRIEDIGTRFDVYAQAEQVVVNVLEGSVALSGLDGTQVLAVLSAGQAAAYDKHGQLIADYRGHVNEATAWLDGLLVFDDMPLSQVAEQLSRYHPVTFKLTDPRLADIKISGRFRTDNLDIMLKTLQASFPVVITKFDGYVLVQAR